MGSRYRPSDSTATVHSASANSDPLTGDLRYIPGGSSAVTPSTESSSYGDPFTGPSRYVSGPSTMSQSPAPRVSVIPVVGHRIGCAKRLLIFLADKSCVIQAGECLCHAREALPVRSGFTQRNCTSGLLDLGLSDLCTVDIGSCYVS